MRNAIWSCLLVILSSLRLPAMEAIPERREFPLATEISPCQDFHAYVCSKVEAAFQLRPDRSIHTFSFNDSRERILEQRKKFLVTLPQASHLSPRTEQIRTTFVSCLNPETRAESERQAVRDLRAVVNKWKDATTLAQGALTNLSLGQDSFIRIFSSTHTENPKLQDATLMVNLMRLPDQKYYQDAVLLTDYEKLLTRFFKTLGANEGDAARRAKAQVQLQKEFIQTYPIASVRADRWSEKHDHSQAEILASFPNLPLARLFRLFPEATRVNTPISESLVFLNAALLKKPLGIWRDTWLLGNVESWLDESAPEYATARFEFEKKYFGGPVQRPDRLERCTNLTAGLFPRELDAAMIDVLYPHFDEVKIQEIAKRVRESLVVQLDNNSWLSPAAKSEALKKMKTARLQLVQPHTDREWNFGPLRLYSETDFVQNLHHHREASWSHTLEELTQPTNQDAWGMSPLTVNASYSENDNKFILPLGILQYPFFDAQGDLTSNLGAVGAVIGHELGHGIDNHGAKFDSDGKLRAWMTPADLAEFQKRGQVLVGQFNKAGYDGNLTLGENVADFVGVTAAYHAAFPKEEGSNEEHKQFFVSYARNWCSVGRPDYMSLLKKVDPHAAGVARINQQVPQQEAFAKAFQCRPGDPMYLPPEQRVKIW